MDQLYPGPLGTADFGKVIAGYFSGLLLPDAVVMNGTNPTLLVTPEAYRTRVHAKNGGVDIVADDFTSIWDTTNEKSLLVTVGPGGLLISERDDLNQTWIDRTTTGNQAAWTGVSIVRSGLLTNTSTAFVVGVQLDGQTLVFERENNGAYIQSTVSTALTNIYELQVLDFNGDGFTDIAAFGDTGILIIRPSGTVLAFMPWTGQLMSTKVTIQGSNRQRIAAVDVGPQQSLYVFSSEQGIEGPFSLGSTQVIALDSADYDDDGDSELFFSITSDTEYQMVLNTPAATTSTFDLANIVHESYGPENRVALNTNAGLAFADFDQDGDMDVLAPVSEDLSSLVPTQGTFRIIHQGVNQTDYMPVLTKFRMTLGTTDWLVLDFDAPIATIASPAGPTPEIMFMFRYTNSFGLTQSTQLMPNQTKFTALGDGQVFFELPVGFVPQGGDDILTVVMRQIAYDPTTSDNAIVNVGPSASFTYASKNQTDAIPTIWPSLILPLVLDEDDDVVDGAGACGVTLPPPMDDMSTGEAGGRGNG